jgi:hypothetical protein
MYWAGPDVGPISISCAIGFTGQFLPVRLQLRTTRRVVVVTQVEAKSIFRSDDVKFDGLVENMRRGQTS